jgi:hypothetical protein
MRLFEIYYGPDSRRMSYDTATKRNSFRAVKNQKIASDFLIFYRSIKFYLIPTEVGKAAIRLRACLRFGCLAKKRLFFAIFSPFFSCVALLCAFKKLKN